MNGELILTDKEVARIITSEIGTENITSSIESGQDGNTINYEIVLADEKIADAVKSYLERRNTELEIGEVVLVEKVTDANKFTF